jgi:hypothetical protein
MKMFEVFVQANQSYKRPKIWAINKEMKKVVFGVLSDGAGGKHEMVLYDDDDLSDRINRITHEGYEPIGNVKTTVDVYCLIGLFTDGKITYKPRDPEGVLQCAKIIVGLDRSRKPQATFKEAIEELELQAKVAQKNKEDPNQEDVNPLVINHSYNDSEWDLMI